MRLRPSFPRTWPGPGQGYSAVQWWSTQNNWDLASSWDLKKSDGGVSRSVLMLGGINPMARDEVWMFQRYSWLEKKWWILILWRKFVRANQGNTWSYNAPHNVTQAYRKGVTWHFTPLQYRFIVQYKLIWVMLEQYVGILVVGRLMK